MKLPTPRAFVAAVVCVWLHASIHTATAAASDPRAYHAALAAGEQALAGHHAADAARAFERARGMQPAAPEPPTPAAKPTPVPVPKPAPTPVPVPTPTPTPLAAVPARRVRAMRCGRSSSWPMLMAPLPGMRRVLMPGGRPPVRRPATRRRPVCLVCLRRWEIRWAVPDGHSS